MLPLLSGSLFISLIALLLATPLSLAAAVYVSQFAVGRERDLLKPVIEGNSSGKLGRVHAVPPWSMPKSGLEGIVYRPAASSK